MSDQFPLAEEDKNIHLFVNPDGNGIILRGITVQRKEVQAKESLKVFQRDMDLWCSPMTKEYLLVHPGELEVDLTRRIFGARLTEI
jgi:hypothetical protein